MVWVVGRKKGDNNQRALRSGEFQRPDQEGARPKPISFCLHLGVLGALLCSDYQLKEVKRGGGSGPFFILAPGSRNGEMISIMSDNGMRNHSSHSSFTCSISLNPSSSPLRANARTWKFSSLGSRHKPASAWTIISLPSSPHNTCPMVGLEGGSTGDEEEGRRGEELLPGAGAWVGWVVEGCCPVPVVSCLSAFLAQPAAGCAG